MGFATLAKVGDGEALGPVKEGRVLVVVTSRTKVTHTEWNALTAAVQSLCETMGLADGSTVGSIEAALDTKDAEVADLDGRTVAPEAVAGLGPVVAEDHGLAGGAAWGVDPTGVASMLAKIDGTTWINPSRETRKNLLAARADDATVVALGARGTVYMVGGNARQALLTYIGTASTCSSSRRQVRRWWRAGSPAS